MSKKIIQRKGGSIELNNTFNVPFKPASQYNAGSFGEMLGKAGDWMNKNSSGILGGLSAVSSAAGTFGQMSAIDSSKYNGLYSNMFGNYGLTNARDNDTLMGSLNNIGIAQTPAAEDYLTMTGKQAGWNIALGAASTGLMTPGPWYLKLGSAALAGITGALGYKKQKRDAERKAQEDAAALSNLQESTLNNSLYAMDRIDENNYANQMLGLGTNPLLACGGKKRKRHFAFGGSLDTDFTNGVTFVNAGGIHETNPLEGVPMGIDDNGEPNLVEEGEVIYNDYVFSNRLSPSDTLLEKNLLSKKHRNHSYAKIAEDISKESQERPNDPISLRTLEANMTRLKAAQESTREDKAYEEFNSLPDQQKEAIIQQAAQQQYAQQMAQQQAMQSQMQGIDPSMMTQPQMIGAFGGNLFDDGGEIINVPNHRFISFVNGVYSINPSEIERVARQQADREIRRKNLRPDSMAAAQIYQQHLDNLSNKAERDFKFYTRGMPAEKIGTYPSIVPTSNTIEGNSIIKTSDNSSVTGNPSSVSSQKPSRMIGVEPYPVSQTQSDATAAAAKSASQSYGYLPFNNQKNKTDYYWIGEDGKAQYDAGYLDWLKNNKFDDQDLYNRLSEYYKTKTGRTLTPEKAIALGQDGKFGEFHSILSDAYTNYLNSQAAAPAEEVVEDPMAESKRRATEVISDALSRYTEKENTSDPLQPWLNGIQDEINASLISDINKPKKNFDATWLRYAPVVGSLFNVAYNRINGSGNPDYSSANALEREVRDLRDVMFSPVGNYLQYNPLDRNYYLNQLNASANASRRGVINSMGNRASAIQGILASDYGYTNGIGNTLMQMEQYNDGQRQRVADFNRATDMYNSEGIMKAGAQNADIQRSRIAGMQNVLAMRDAERNRAGLSLSSDLTNLFDNIGNIGVDEMNRNMVMSNPAWYYDLTRRGNVNYKGNSSKCGGYLTIKKKKK